MNNSIDVLSLTFVGRSVFRHTQQILNDGGHTSFSSVHILGIRNGETMRYCFHLNADDRGEHRSTRAERRG